MAFRCVGSLVEEMQRLEALRQRDPESAANLVANGKLIVELGTQGKLGVLQFALDHMEEDRVLVFYSVRLFRVACASNRIDILQFMLNNGFDLTQSCVQDALHSIIERIEDAQAADSAQSLVRFLIQAGADVNWQRTGDLYTALHVACCKNLYPIAYLLILFGADVNAVAMNDDMPLLCAENAINADAEGVSSVHRTQNELLLNLLRENGARRTWRTAKPSVAKPAAPAMELPSGGRILSFSSLCCINDNNEDDEDDGIRDLDCGIMLETPEFN